MKVLGIVGIEGIDALLMTPTHMPKRLPLGQSCAQ